MIYTIKNTGTSVMQWRVYPSATWIGLTSTSGSLTPNGSANIVVSVNTNGTTLSVGSYSGSLSFVNNSGGQGNTTRNIYLVVTTPTTGSAVMSVLPTSAMVFTGPVGGPFAFKAN